MAKFRDREERRLVAARDALFGDPGLGFYRGIQRAFVLAQPELNLWAGIRQDAIDYFRRHRIGWHSASTGKPTGHVLSSQVACLNHLFPLRQRPDLAAATLKAIDAEIVAAEMVDDGFVEFEFIGRAQRLKERSFTRGANCTSVDAAMIGRTMSGERRLFLIEWKYVESYSVDDKYIDERAKVYDDLIAAADSPFLPRDPSAFYYEPFYQLMRQTLLGSLIARHQDLGCRSYRHVHVAPEQNREFHFGLTAPDIKGPTVAQAWMRTLKRPDWFVSTTPRDFLKPVIDGEDTEAFGAYLESRYWRCA